MRLFVFCESCWSPVGLAVTRKDAPGTAFEPLRGGDDALSALGHFRPLVTFAEQLSLLSINVQQ